MALSYKKQFERERAAKQKLADAAWRKVHADRRYQQVEARHSALIKNAVRAQDMYLVSKRPEDKLRWERAERAHKRYARVRQNYEDALLAKHGHPSYASALGRDPRRARTARDKRSFDSTREARVFARTLSDSGFPGAIVGEDRAGAFVLYPHGVPGDAIRSAERSVSHVARHLSRDSSLRSSSRSSRSSRGARKRSVKKIQRRRP